MARQKRRRSRGLVFTTKGWEKLVAKKQMWENAHKSGKKCTLEDLSEITGLSYNTVLKIQERRQGVDKRSLTTFSLAFGIELDSSDYISPSFLTKSNPEHHTKKVNWDEPIELASFYGRSTELALLEQWSTAQSCRLITVQGLRGIGKTALCVKLIDRVQHKFDSIIWRSLDEKSSLKELLAELVGVLNGKPQGTDASCLSIRRIKQQLLSCLRAQKCLIVLDGLDKTMICGQLCGSYSSKYQDFAYFTKYIGQTAHQSCFLLITREKPKEMSSIEGKSTFVRSLKLDRLSNRAGKEMLLDLKLLGTDAEHSRLAERFCGHPSILQMVAEEIALNYERQITRFLFLEGDFQLHSLHNFWHQHLERLSAIERRTLFTIANCQSPSFFTLRHELPSSIPSHRIIDSLESLLRRSLIVKKSATFSICSQLLKFVYLLMDEYLINRS